MILQQQMISDKLTSLPADIQPHVRNICEFVALFPKDSMETELWDLIIQLIEDKDESSLPAVLVNHPQIAFNRLKVLCRSVQAIANGYQVEHD